LKQEKNIGGESFDSRCSLRMRILVGCAVRESVKGKGIDRKHVETSRPDRDLRSTTAAELRFADLNVRTLRRGVHTPITCMNVKIKGLQNGLHISA